MLTTEIKREVLRLKPEDRILMAELIYESLDKPEKEIEKMWVNESEERYEAYKAGRIKGIPLDEIKKKYDR